MGAVADGRDRRAASPAILFARGARHARVSISRRIAFWFGLVALYVALHTRLDYFFEHEFFMHRLQHLVLHHLGPFLIALSYPGAALRAGIPFAWRQRWLRPAAQTPHRARVLDIVFNPVVAVALFVGLIYFWLLSPIHFKAMLDYRLYRVMNWSMVIDGLLFWWLILDPRPAPPARLAPGRRVLVVIAAIPPQIILGAYIFFTPHELYPIYSICGRAFTWITPMRDQQIGGLLAVDSRIDDERDRRADRVASLAAAVGAIATEKGTSDAARARRVSGPKATAS